MSSDSDNSKILSATGWIALLVALIICGVIMWSNNKRLQQADQKLEAKDAQLDQMDSLLVERNIRIAALEKLLDEAEPVPVEAQWIGVWYEVQLGAFTDFNLDEYIDGLVELRQERDGNAAKLLLGRFRSIHKARLFENDIHRLGLNDAYVVGRIDGKIVDVDVALEEARRRNKQ